MILAAAGNWRKATDILVIGVDVVCNGQNHIPEGVVKSVSINKQESN